MSQESENFLSKLRPWELRDLAGYLHDSRKLLDISMMKYLGVIERKCRKFYHAPTKTYSFQVIENTVRKIDPYVVVGNYGIRSQVFRVWEKGVLHELLYPYLVNPCLVPSPADDLKSVWGKARIRFNEFSSDRFADEVRTQVLLNL